MRKNLSILLRFLFFIWIAGNSWIFSLQNNDGKKFYYNHYKYNISIAILEKIWYDTVNIIFLSHLRSHSTTRKSHFGSEGHSLSLWQNYKRRQLNIYEAIKSYSIIQKCHREITIPFDQRLSVPRHFTGKPDHPTGARQICPWSCSRWNSLCRDP